MDTQTHTTILLSNRIIFMDREKVYITRHPSQEEDADIIFPTIKWK